MGRTVAFSPIGVVGTSPAEKRDHEERGRRGGREAPGAITPQVAAAPSAMTLGLPNRDMSSTNTW